MDWKLTDEEIQNLPYLSRGYFRPFDYIAEAQAKKLVGELEAINKYKVFGFEDGTLLIYKEDWQELRRRVGLE